MKKRFSSLVAAVVVASTLSMIGAAAPAQAANECVAQGTAVLGAGIGPSAVYGTKNTTFTITSTAGTCPSVHASGSGTFSCGASSGSGTITIGGDNHGTFTFTTLGTTLSGTGARGVKFDGNATPDATKSGSCATGDARFFLVTVVLSHD